jgi:hypothetical protein
MVGPMSWQAPRPEIVAIGAIPSPEMVVAFSGGIRTYSEEIADAAIREGRC